MPPKDLGRGSGFLDLSLAIPVSHWGYEGDPDVGLNSSLSDSCEEGWTVDPEACRKASFMYKMFEESPRAGVYGGK